MLMAATLVVGGTLAATIIPSADAYKKGGGGKGNGNTITEHKMKDLAWQQQQQTQAQTESESISTTCINDQPCHTTAWNTNTPYSPKVNHNRMTISTTCINDQPCHTTAWNTTKSLSQNYPSVDDGDIEDLIDDITG